MSILEDLADALARDAIESAERLGDDRLIDEMSKAIGESSPTTQEAFVTAVRIRRALGRGRGIMEERLGRPGAGTPGAPPEG